MLEVFGWRINNAVVVIVKWQLVLRFTPGADLVEQLHRRNSKDLLVLQDDFPDVTILMVSYIFPHRSR